MFLNNAMDFCREMETYHFWPISRQIWPTAVRGSKCLSKCYKSFRMIFFVITLQIWASGGHVV